MPTSHEGTTRKPQARNRCGHGPVAPVQIAPQSQRTLIEPNYTENPTVQTHAKNHRPCANYVGRGRCDWEARTWPRTGAIHVNRRTNSRPYVRTWKQTSSKHRRITGSEFVLADIENPMQRQVTFVRIAGRDARPRRGVPRSARPEVEAVCKCKAEGGSHSPKPIFVMLSSHGRGAPAHPKRHPKLKLSETASTYRPRDTPKAFQTATQSKQGSPAASTHRASVVGRGSTRSSQARLASETGANPGQRRPAAHNPVVLHGETIDRFCPLYVVIIHGEH